MADDPTSAQLVRSLINDDHTDDSDNVFSDTEIDRFLFLEGGNVKLAAAQALDVIASNEALVSKVLKTQAGVSTDGPKVADAVRKQAASLREQAYDQDDDGAVFEIVSLDPTVDCLPYRCW